MVAGGGELVVSVAGAVAGSRSVAEDEGSKGWTQGVSICVVEVDWRLGWGNVRGRQVAMMATAVSIMETVQVIMVSCDLE